MKSNLKSWRVAAPPIAVLALSACASGFYDTALSRLNYGGTQRPASIQVSDPQLYKRESLINERREEAAYLADLLKASKEVEFTPELLRDIEMVKSMSAQLGLSFDAGARQQYNQAAQLSDLEQQIAATKLQMQLVQVRRDLDLLQDSLAAQTAPSGAAGSAGAPAANTAASKVTAPGLDDAKGIALRLEELVKGLTARLDQKSTAPRLSTASVSPREVFQDRQAYRRDIQSAINANALDELHDLDANSLFRMQFHAIVMPGEAKDELGVLQMRVKRPEFVLNDEGRNEVIENFYLEWLAHATLRLNERDEESDTIRPDPAVLLLGAEGRVLSITTLTIPKEVQARSAEGGDENAKSETECKASIEFGLGPQSSDCYVVRIAIPPALVADVTKLSSRIKHFGPTARNRLDKDLNELEAATRRLSDKPSQEACNELFRTYLDAGSPPSVSRTVASLVTQLQRNFRVATAQAGLSSSDALVAFTVANAPFVGMAAAFESAYLDLKKKCGEGPPQAKAESIVPDDFLDALFEKIENKDKAAEKQTAWKAKGRVSAYAVSPIALAQRVSTAARAADAIQIAASLAAVLPTQGLGLNTGLGYMRSVTGKVDALERVPLVIGYSSPNMYIEAEGKVQPDTAGFGWLLGPKVVLDPKKKALALEHNLAPYDLTADVSMPGWWPHVDIVSEAAWAPNWRGADRNAVISLTQSESPGSKRTIRMPMRHSRGDLDGVTWVLSNSKGGPRVPIAWISLVTPRAIPDCATSITLVVRGTNIWRAQSAYLLGLPGDNIAVLPDMAGISVTFDISKLPPASRKASLLVATPDGPASYTIEIYGDRSDGKKCVKPSPPPKDDGSPTISSVLPETVYACDEGVRIIAQGRNLKNPTSVYLGNIEIKPVKASTDGRTLVFKIDKKIDGTGGMQASLPLIVTTRKGVASKDVAIERDDCSRPRTVSAPLSALALPSGSLDLCAKEATLMIVGGEARRIDAARIVSTAPKFDLPANAVRIFPKAGAAEFTFAGFPSKDFTGPGSFQSPVQAVLYAGKQEVARLNVPATCSQYPK